MPLSRRQVLGGAALATLPLAGLTMAVRTASRTRDTRAVIQRVPASPTRDGAGVKLSRILGGRTLPMLDPFILLDEFHSDQPDDFMRGFPDHPHRGFETVTIMLDGEVAHRDSVGNHGVIGKGAVQWMTAARGIVHSEMPRAATPGGDLWGYQLWVNLPAKHKMEKPRYQEMGPSAFTSVDLDDAKARVLAGRVGGVRGPIEATVDPTVLDLQLEPGARFRHDIPADHVVALYAIRGNLRVGDHADPVSTGTFAVLGAGSTVELRAEDAARVLLLAARPIGEPVARRGPFVMNTDDEIRQAFEDYRSGRLVQG